MFFKDDQNCTISKIVCNLKSLKTREVSRAKEEETSA
jgi:hypothetical protein